MTPASLGLRVLKYSGITSYTPTVNDASLNERGIVTGDVDDLLATMNAAAQEVCALAPAALTELPLGDVLRAPFGVSLSVTQYSKTVAVTGWASWMESCTIRLGGDNQDNRLESQTALLLPYMGETGTVTGMVYADAILLPAYTLTVLEPISIPDRRLALAADAADFERLPLVSAAYHGNGAICGIRDGSLKPTGTPGFAFVDSVWNDTRAYLSRFLRVSPAPDRAYPIQFRTKREPKPFTQADLYTGTTYGTDPNAIIPADWVESILLPFTLQRWTAHPSFIGTPAQVQEIARQYSHARRALDAMRPSQSRTRATYV